MIVHDLIVQTRRFWHKSWSRPWVHLTRPLRREFKGSLTYASRRSRQPLKLIDELAALFLADVIKERVSYLAELSRDKLTPEQIEKVKLGYISRLTQALTNEDAANLEAGGGRAAIKAVGNFEEFRIFTGLGLRDFRTPAGFGRMLRRVEGPSFVSPFHKRDAPSIAGVLLRALQHVALGIVPGDYPRNAVPAPTQQAIRDLLARIERLSRALRPVRPPLSYMTAEAVLRVAEARSEGRVWLPLRPIPTAALSFEDKNQKYPGRSDEEARRLARQIRHADGAILTTGYRGVGKSTFINRVLYHTLSSQSGALADEWLVVPVTISMAKVAGVKSILRLTVKAVHTQLLNPNATPRPIPGRSSKSRLPLTEDERALLQAAYERSTLKVALTREEGVEQKREVGASLKLDPGRLIGLSLGKFVSISGSRSRIEKVNRQLSLLDYDENAAEEDLADLIRQLAQERPLRRGGPNVRIKLIFVFDELDKMDIEKGLKPMIEGLKNLFLQQHAVFILITSKKFYYNLLEDRAKEDAILNSYFSAIVHVPLLTYAEVRKILEHWIDTDAVTLPREPSNNPEIRLLDLLARFLTYRSLGNPREIIRELRQMEVWAESGGRPYLTDRITQLPELPIFAAIQEAIELVAAPPASATSGPDGERGVTLVSERLKSDQARLEQLRRGLYILAEEVINRQILSLRAADLEKLITNNFSQLSPPDVVQVASRLGNQLKALSANLPLDVFSPLVAPGQPLSPFALFALEHQTEGETIKATDEFYTLIGRRPSLVEPVAASAQKQIRTIEELIADAQYLSNHGGRAERGSAINIIGEILEHGSAVTPNDLKAFLLDVVSNDADAVYRQAAALRLRPEILFNTPGFDLMGRIRAEVDERVLSNLISLLGKASTEQDRKLATEALLELLGRETAPLAEGAVAAPKLTDDNLIDLLTTLQTVANQDITAQLLDWITQVTRPELVMNVVLRTLNSNASAYSVNLTDRLFDSDGKTLGRFLSRKNPARALMAGPSVLPGSHLLWQAGAIEKWLRDILGSSPGESAERLLMLPNPGPDTIHLLASLWQVAIERADAKAARVILKALSLPLSDRQFVQTQQSLGLVLGFTKQALPYLKEKLGEMTAEGTFTADQVMAIERALDSITKESILSSGADYANANTRLDINSILRWTAATSPSEFVPKSRVWPHVLCSIAGLVAFVATFVVFRDGLSARGIGMFVLTRAGMFLIDAATFAVLASILRSGTRGLLMSTVKGDGGSGGGVGSSSNPANATTKQLLNNFGIFAVLGAAYWVHQRIDGSLSGSAHVAILGLNFVAIGLLAYGLSPLFKRR